MEPHPDSRFFANNFLTVIKRHFPHLEEEFHELVKRKNALKPEDYLFSEIQIKLKNKFPNLFLESKDITVDFFENFRIDNVGNLNDYVQGALMDIVDLEEEIEDAFKSDQLKIRSRVKSVKSIEEKAKTKNLPYVKDLMGFQIITLSNDIYPIIVQKAEDYLQNKLAVFGNLFALSHEVAQSKIGINSVHHKALHYYFSHMEKYPVELQIVPRFTFLWHQINHDTLYKTLKEVSYEEELAIRYFGYICNNIDYLEILGVKDS